MISIFEQGQYANSLGHDDNYRRILKNFVYTPTGFIRIHDMIFRNIPLHVDKLYLLEPVPHDPKANILTRRTPI